MSNSNYYIKIKDDLHRVYRRINNFPTKFSYYIQHKRINQNENYQRLIDLKDKHMGERAFTKAKLPRMKVSMQISHLVHIIQCMSTMLELNSINFVRY